ncbi:proton pump-interactor 1-like protein [Tanacetum coccineum]
MCLIGVDLDGARKDQQAIKAKVKTLETEKEALNSVIASLEDELHAVVEKRDKVYDKIRELRNKKEEGNTCYYQNCSLLNDARRLDANKDVTTLKELSTSEAGTSSWLSGTVAKREKPLIAPEPTPAPVETEVVAKPKAKQPKEDPSPVSVPPPVVERKKTTKIQRRQTVQ